MDLPEHFGSWKGAHNRLRKWAADGTWERVFTALLAQADTEGDLDWVLAVDSTIVRARQHVAGARQRGSDQRAGRPCPRTVPGRTDYQDPPHRRQPPRSPGIVLTPGQAGDAPTFSAVMTRFRVPQPIGRPRTTPEVVLADKSYSAAHPQDPGRPRRGFLPDRPVHLCDGPGVGAPRHLELFRGSGQRPEGSIPKDAVSATLAPPIRRHERMQAVRGPPQAHSRCPQEKGRTALSPVRPSHRLTAATADECRRG